jgi:MFS superfamily sulfate permease-like transporter
MTRMAAHSLRLRAGLSNIITSLTGAGLTGSYIFSQTIFSMRAGVHTRLHGWIIAGAVSRKD